MNKILMVIGLLCTSGAFAGSPILHYCQTATSKACETQSVQALKSVSCEKLSLAGDKCEKIGKTFECRYTSNNCRGLADNDGCESGYEAVPYQSGMRSMKKIAKYEMLCRKASPVAAPAQSSKDVPASKSLE